MRPRRWKLLTAIVVAAILLGAIMLFPHGDEAVGVSTAPTTIEDLQNLVTTNGSVVPTSEFQARANFPGIVQKIYVELGDKVKPGQMLVSMKDPFASSRVASATSNLAAANLAQQNMKSGGSQEERIGLAGDLAHAQLSVKQAENSVAALQALEKKGAASQAEVNAAKQQLDSAKQTLKTLQERKTGRFSSGDLRSAAARVADARANLGSAKIQFDNAYISSPMAGTVYSINVAAWDFVPMGADLIRVADLNHVEVKAFFDEPEIGKLKAGQAVRIAWDGRPDRVWHGHIKQAPVAAMALGPRSVGECIITVDDSKEDLLPNTNVIVTVMIEQHKHVLTIPRGALHTDGSNDFVYRVLDGRLQRVPVTVGIVNLDRAEITSGLSDDQTVAISAEDNRDLRDGLAVRPARSAAKDSTLMRIVRGRLFRVRSQ